MEDINIKLSELKHISNSILSILSEISGVEKEKINFKTSINNDLGIQGGILEEIIITCEEVFKTDFSGLKYSEYFYDDYELSKLKTINFYLIPIRLVLFSATVLFNKKFARKAIRYTLLENKKPLTVGDLITSAVEKRFVQRKERSFRLIYN
jgi:hypothetical protein